MAFTKAPGVEDIFPDKISKWNNILSIARKQFELHNFKEIVTPILEYTELFSRGIGDETDIVSKEMFTLEDRGGRSLTLRPEGTAGVVRAYCENGEYNRLSVAKLFYIGSMFRAERPQKGRLRQFNQLGAELFGEDSPYYDFEIVSMINSIAQGLHIKDYVLLINSIGCDKCRNKYLEELKKYFENKKEHLCEDCKKRLDKNVLRILDCKKDNCKVLKENAPKLPDYLCDECKEHHASFKNLLDNANITYQEDPFLVRGLDYYCKTTFEFVTTALGGQNAFAAGGRYNKLVEMLGGKPTPAVGFAAGIERLLLLTEEEKIEEKRLDLFVAYCTDAERLVAIEIITQLRALNISCDIDPTGKSLKNQLKKMDRENALFALVIGEDEIKSGIFTLKNCNTREQIKIERSKIAQTILETKKK